LADYTAFAAASAPLLAEHGLEHEACVTKMRLLSLAALGAEAGAEGVPYALVRETLGIEAGAVEAWVVQAISAKVVEAKMDQVRERVLITKHVHRTFGPAQWEALRVKLQSWRDATASYATSA
jgi:translation initiation factor 3 subunit M